VVTRHRVTKLGFVSLHPQNRNEAKGEVRQGRGERLNAVPAWFIVRRAEEAGMRVDFQLLDRLRRAYQREHAVAGGLRTQIIDAEQHRRHIAGTLAMAERHAQGQGLDTCSEPQSSDAPMIAVRYTYATRAVLRDDQARAAQGIWRYLWRQCRQGAGADR
jgi:hypothetical protein